MNKEQIEGKWEQFKGEVKKTWGKLTDDEIAYFNGESERFYGAVKEKYGIAKEEATKRVKELEDRFGYYRDDKAA